MIMLTIYIHIQQWIQVNNVLTVKRSKNMKMCWKKFQVTFNIKLNYLSNEIKDESKNYA